VTWARACVRARVRPSLVCVDSARTSIIPVPMPCL
jgi:hypothetical protein